MEPIYLVVKTWKRVQDYLGTKLGTAEGESLGIKWNTKNTNKKSGKLYYIPYNLLFDRLSSNQQKKIKLEKSVKLIKEQIKTNVLFKQFVEEQQNENNSERKTN